MFVSESNLFFLQRRHEGAELTNSHCSVCYSPGWISFVVALTNSVITRSAFLHQSTQPLKYFQFSFPTNQESLVIPELVYYFQELDSFYTAIILVQFFVEL